MEYSHDKLINQATGEFDWRAIKRFALDRAVRSSGRPNPSRYYLRDELSSLKGMATVIRRRWREAHGLPDDAVYVQMDVAAWGASGDSFGAGR